MFTIANVCVQDSGIDIGDIRDRKALRERLRCKPFSWFLKNIYSEMRTYTDIIAFGVVSIHFFSNSSQQNRCYYLINR